MKMKLWSWTARSLAAGALLAAAFAAPPTFAQTPPPVNPSEVLTDDVIVRVLGMEKDKNPFTLPASSDPEAKTKSETVNKVRTEFAEAIAAFQRGDARTAEARLTEAKKLDDTLSKPSVYLARLCFAVNDQNLVKVGRAFLDKAENEDPNAPEPYMMLGNLALLEGRLADANLNFKQALLMVASKEGWSAEQKNTFLKNVYGGLVSVSEQRGNWEKGLTDINLWIGLDPNDAVAMYRKARLEFMRDPKKNVEEARKVFDEAYKLAEAARNGKSELPSVPPTELALLELQTQTNNLEGARAEIKNIDAKVASIATTNPKEGSRINSTVSQWYLGQGEFPAASKYAEAAAALDKDSPAIKQLTAVLEYFSGAASAEASFTKLNQEAPDDMFAANYLALVLIEQPEDAKRQKAVKIAELSARLNPKSPVALATLGWCYFNMDKLSEAAQIFAALEQEKNLQISADMAYYMAKTFGSLPVDQFPNGIPRGRELLGKVVGTKGAFKHKKEAEIQFKAWGGKIATAAPENRNVEITPPVKPNPTGTPAGSGTTPPAGSGTTPPPGDK